METQHMRNSPLSILLAGLVILVGVTQTLGQTLCKPALAFKEVRLSEMRAVQRVWTARLAVDASRCETTSGSFNINFIRLKETAPDLLFTEQFTWRPGQVEVSMDFWADEAVLDYSIGHVASCACRN
jgi:hypothetical protein